MKYILALDQGTTSSRAILFDAAGSIRAGAQKEFRQIFPQPGWVEHDPEEIWSTQIGVAAEAVARAGLQSSDIAAIGITNQRETTVVWDRKTGVPIGNAIVWQDRRTAGICDRLQDAQGLERLIKQKTGLGGGRLFFREQGAVDSGQHVRGRATKGRGRGSWRSARWIRGSCGNSQAARCT